MRLLSPKEVILLRLRLDRLNYVRHAHGLSLDEESEAKALINTIRDHHHLIEDIKLGEVLLGGCGLVMPKTINAKRSEN